MAISDGEVEKHTASYRHHKRQKRPLSSSGVKRKKKKRDKDKKRKTNKKPSSTDAKWSEGLARCPEKHMCMFPRVCAGRSGTGLL